MKVNFMVRYVHTNKEMQENDFFVRRNIDVSSNV